MSSPNVRRVSAVEVVPLRRAVLRPEMDPEESVYPEDRDRSSRHFACFSDETIVSVGSSFLQEGWRLRGMATLPEVQGRGFGTKILEAICEDLRERGGGRVWCNARISAAGFYRRNGFVVVGDEFDLPGIGAHFVMEKWIE